MQKIAGMLSPASGPQGKVATKGTPAEFLKLAPAKRLDFAKKFKDSEKPLGPFLDTLMSELQDPKDKKKVFEMRRFGDDPGSDPRLILEHLALVLNV
jgi:hypothetical protein